jgi:hypothetical protein
MAPRLGTRDGACVDRRISAAACHQEQRALSSLDRPCTSTSAVRAYINKQEQISFITLGRSALQQLQFQAWTTTRNLPQSRLTPITTLHRDSINIDFGHAHKCRLDQAVYIDYDIKICTASSRITSTPNINVKLYDYINL